MDWNHLKADFWSGQRAAGPGARGRTYASNSVCLICSTVWVSSKAKACVEAEWSNALSTPESTQILLGEGGRCPCCRASDALDSGHHLREESERLPVGREDLSPGPACCLPGPSESLDLLGLVN